MWIQWQQLCGYLFLGNALHRNLAPNVSSGFGTECYRDTTRRPCGSMVPVGELRKALVEHFAPQASLLGEDVWFGEDFVSVVNSFFG